MAAEQLPVSAPPKYVCTREFYVISKEIDHFKYVCWPCGNITQDFDVVSVDKYDAEREKWLVTARGREPTGNARIDYHHEGPARKGNTLSDLLCRFQTV